MSAPFVGEVHTLQPKTQIRILLVDDHTFLRAGTRRILEDESDLLVIGEAGDGADALQLVAKSQPDLVLLDIEMPGIDGIKTYQALRQDWPTIRILILTGHKSLALMRTLDRLGVDGCLLKSADPHTLIAAIRSVMDGSRIYGDDVAHMLNKGMDGEKPTAKELEILQAIARGLRNRDISEDLHLSINTIEYHLRNIFLKLGAVSRTDALVRAQRLGWLDTQEPLC